jgi:hypothetical protein
MRLHSRLPGLLGYSVAAVCGAIVLAAYWWFSGTILSPTPAIPVTVPQPTPSVDTEKLARELADRLKTKPHSPVVRAHIHVTKFEWNIPVDVGGRARVKVFFANDGNAPITKWISSDHAGFYPLKDADSENQARSENQLKFENEFCCNEPEITAEHLNASDNEIPVGVDRSVEIFSAPWGKGAIDLFLANRAFLYVSGVMAYADAHGTHRTRFCGYTGADNNMKFCHKHNEEP